EPIGTPGNWDVVAQANTAGIGLDLLGLKLVDVGAVTSIATCSAQGPSTASASANVAKIGLLNGAITVGVAQDSGLLEVKVGDTTIVGSQGVHVDIPNLLGNTVKLSL